MKTTTEGCARLVEKAAQLVLSVVEEATQVDSLTPRMMERVERLEVSAPLFIKLSMWTRSRIWPSRLLSDILDFMRSRLSSQANLKWYGKYWERDSLQADLELHTARYEDAMNAFNVCHSVLMLIGFTTVANLFCTHHNQITTLIDMHHTVANLPASQCDKTNRLRVDRHHLTEARPTVSSSCSIFCLQ
jgi:hypothetical protein